MCIRDRSPYHIQSHVLLIDKCLLLLQLQLAFHAPLLFPFLQTHHPSSSDISQSEANSDLSVLDYEERKAVGTLNAELLALSLIHIFC